MNFNILAPLVLTLIISSCGLKTKPRPLNDKRLKSVDQKYIDLYKENTKTLKKE